jgi:hypothetical protein
MTSKILDAAYHAQTSERLKELHDKFLGDNEAGIQRRMAAMGSMSAVVDMITQMQAYITATREFVLERERVGEYDASATAIIELSKLTLKMAEFQLVSLQALVNFKLDALR